MSAQDHYDKVMIELKKMLVNLKFGSVTIVVQNGKVIQLEKNEKVRLT
ncbi:YezD family protein [Bacillus sp. FJAT-47783]|nr:YezD family protein [Bacillus sp. FJAT-47783]